MHPIDKLCQDHGIKRTELARRMGVDESVPRSWVRRNTSVDNITFGNIRAISKVLDIPLEQLDETLKQMEKNI